MRSHRRIGSITKEVTERSGRDASCSVSWREASPTSAAELSARRARAPLVPSPSWFVCRRALVGFSTLSSTLFESVEPLIKAQLEQVRTLISPALDSFAEHAHAAQTALYESNNPLVKQVFTLLGQPLLPASAPPVGPGSDTFLDPDHPLALQTRAFFDTQLITRIVLTLFILQAGRYNANRLAKRKLARANSDTPDMVDFGLGASGFGMASGSRGKGDHGEIELHWAGNKCARPLSSVPSRGGRLTSPGPARAGSAYHFRRPTRPCQRSRRSCST